MGRHSAEPADASPAAPAPPHDPAPRPVGPITDPVLLVAIEEELRRFRHGDEPPLTTGAVRRVETPFSGPVDVPVENAIGPEPLPPVEPTVTWMPAMRAPADDAAVARRAMRSLDAIEAHAESQPAAPAPQRTTASSPAVAPRSPYAPPVPAPAPQVAAFPIEVPSPVPVPARGSAADPLPGSTPAADGPAPQQRLGVSVRTLLLCTGIGVLLVAALSLVTLLPR